MSTYEMLSTKWNYHLAEVSANESFIDQIALPVRALTPVSSQHRLVKYFHLRLTAKNPGAQVGARGFGRGNIS